ncbi:hypothetical protein [Echinicola sp. 20G]|uniref:hypothetical protein n=1 Tax=Echinicola sp. 20G TaxID=2781961 RepID=UPI00190FE6A0|nr:hypothetical protein [Echinicola sp. 20G]
MENHYKKPKMLKRLQLISVLMLLVISSCYAESTVVLSDLRCEYRTDPLGIDNTAPR